VAPFPLALASTKATIVASIDDNHVFS